MAEEGCRRAYVSGKYIVPRDSSPNHWLSSIDEEEMVREQPWTSGMNFLNSMPAG